MRVNRHIFFDPEKVPGLEEYLASNRIPYESMDAGIVFDIADDSEYWSAISRLAAGFSVCMSETVFTDQEKREAEWLLLRSKWKNGYPQPESSFSYRNITYTAEHFCPACGIGLRQIDSFRMKTSPKWGGRHFMMLNWIDDELFMDETAMTILQNSGLTGFTFLPVKDKTGTKPLPDICQLVIERAAGPGLLTGGSDIDDVCACKQCGRLKYHPTGIGMHRFSGDALRSLPDICRTHESFGWGQGAGKRILIRQDMYRCLVEHHLDRGLVFEPIEVVD